MAYVYHMVAIRVNEISWVHVWRLRFSYLRTGYDIEAVQVAPTQPEGDVSSARTPEPQEEQAESWTSGSRMARVEPWKLRWAQPKS
jgi:hypothetical protein